MSLLAFCLYLLIGMTVVDKIVLPVLAGLQFWPAGQLADKPPKLAAAWFRALTPLYWIGELSWLVFTVWFTRTRGLQSSARLWPLFIFLGWSFALYPSDSAAKAMGKGSIIVSILSFVWIVLMVISFFVVK